MSEQQTTQELMADISQRLQSLGEQVSEARLTAVVKTYLDGLMADESFVRKMRFGAGENRLIGSKFSRHNLGVSDIEFLHDIQQALKGHPKPEGGVYGGPSEELTNAFRDISEALYMPEEQVIESDKRALDDLWPRVPKQFRNQREYNRALDAIYGRTADSGAAGAMDTADSGYGSSLIGAQYVRDLWEAARNESRVFNLFDPVDMTDPTMYVPVEADLPTMLLATENTIRDPSEFTPYKTGTNRVTLTAKKFIIYQIWSTEMEEDSLIPFIPFLRRQVQLSLAHYLDAAVLNGDTTDGGAQINHDTDPAATDYYLAWDGLRHVGLVDVTTNQDNIAAALVYDDLLKPKGRMMSTTYLHDWGHPTRPEDLVYVAEPNTADQIALLDEVLTVDKFGSGATVLTGQQARIGQHPLISSMALGKALATGYVHSTTGNDYGVVVVFNRRAFKVGWRRRVKTNILFEPGLDQTKMLHSLRVAFGRYSPTGAASGIEGADILFNITL